MLKPFYKKVAKIYKIPRFSKLSKSELIKAIINIKAVLRIQRFYRSLKINNNLCPISLEKIHPNTPCYAFKSNNSFIYYKLEYIIEHILVSGDFRDPISRKEYTAHQLQQIDMLAKMWKIKKKSVYRFYSSPVEQRKRSRLNTRRNELEILQRILDELNGQFIELLECTNSSYQNMPKEFYINTILYSNFRSYFTQMSIREPQQSIELINEFIIKISNTVSIHTALKNNIISFITQLKNND